MKSCPKGGYTKEAPKKGSVVLAGPAGLTSSWQTAAPKQGKTAASPKSPKSTSFFSSFSNGQFVSGVHGWGLSGHGGGFKNPARMNCHPRICHPKQLSKQKQKRFFADTGWKKTARTVIRNSFQTKKNYTSVDPKQFTVSKFRLKPVILISEYFCSRCGHNGRQPETMGDNGRRDHFRAQEADHTNQHQGGQI